MRLWKLTAQVLRSAGSAIPVNISLGGNRRLEVVAVTCPVSYAHKCVSALIEDAIEVAITTGARAFSYDATAGRFVNVWKSLKTLMGCHELTFTLEDGRKKDPNGADPVEHCRLIPRLDNTRKWRNW